MESRLLLNVVVGKGTAIFKLLAGKNKTLLVRWDTFLVLDLGLDIVDSIARLDLKGDGLASESLNNCGELGYCFFFFFFLSLAVIESREERKKKITYKSAYRHEDEEQGEESIPSECCSLRVYDRLQAVYQQRSNVAGPEEYLPYPGSWS